MKLIKGLQDSLKDLNAIVNVYYNQVSFNKPINLTGVSDTKIEGYNDRYYFKVLGSGLVITELSNITVIKGKVKKVLYEYQ